MLTLDEEIEDFPNDNGGFDHGYVEKSRASL